MANRVSTAQTLGRYLKELEAAGFSRDEALGLVGHVAPIDMEDLDTAPVDGRPRSVGLDPLRIVVLAGSREEAARWKSDQFVLSPTHVGATSGTSPLLLARMSGRWGIAVRAGG